MKRIHRLLILVCALFVCLCLGGCSAESTDVKKIRDLEFTVVKESEIPEELMQRIESKKSNEFKCTFYNKDTKEDLYIVVGYGKQMTGGYSVTVDELFLTNNAIYIDTSLLGPSKDDVITQAITYPYVVVKIKFMDLPVVFT